MGPCYLCDEAQAQSPFFALQQRKVLQMKMSKILNGKYFLNGKERMRGVRDGEIFSQIGDAIGAAIRRHRSLFSRR